jgi:hypothetical protein
MLNTEHAQKGRTIRNWRSGVTISGKKTRASSVNWEKHLAEAQSGKK